MLNTLKTLCALNGVSSWEDEVRACLMERARPYASEMRVDALGNLIVFKKGTKSTGNKLMLAAHMDEVGIIIKSADEEGYLKFAGIGGIDRRVLIGKRVAVGPNKVDGIIGLKAYHLVSDEEEKRTPKLEDLYIDIGAKSKDDALSKIKVGDVGAFVSDCVEFGNGLLKAKALDDRIGCAVMLKVLEQELPMDCTFAFTVQEEVGTRGAFGAAFSVSPEIALVLEGTTAADIPSMKPSRQVCAPGKGPVLSYMDGTTIYDRALFERMRGLANENGITWQTKHYISGGTDASTIQRSKAGVRVCAISAAVRYLHTPSSVAAIQDIEEILRLASLFIDSIAAEC